MKDAHFAAAIRLQGTGGDIDCFAGDAILIVYETERVWRLTDDGIRASLKGADGRPVDKLTLATMAAAQCGGRLLNKLSPYYFSDGETDATLTLHGSVGVGNIQSVNIGGPAGHVSRVVQGAIMSGFSHTAGRTA